ncbi:MAG: hypothetical protein MZU84_06135 [Sphingobacterium sp.]|nr:hypothetical protein [Sphingobacterium sp.]
MLWLGSRMMRGVRFVFRFLIGKIKNWRKKAPRRPPSSRSRGRAGRRRDKRGHDTCSTRSNW